MARVNRELRPGLYRPRGEMPPTPGQPFWTHQGVTYVSGTFCNPCVQSGHQDFMAGATGLEPATYGFGDRRSTN
jgi:hypothetical protein